MRGLEKKLHPMAQADRQTDRQTDGHDDSMTNLAQSHRVPVLRISFFVTLTPSVHDLLKLSHSV